MQRKLLLLLVIGLVPLVALIGCDDEDCPSCPEVDTTGTTSVSELLATSQHFTTAGMEYFYAEENGGFEGLTGVPYEDLSCQNCHAGPADCNLCHETNAAGELLSPENSACLACHGRQGKEINTAMLTDGTTPVADPHFDGVSPDLTCANCHTGDAVHGSGTPTNSMWDDGFGKYCTDAGCHDGDLSTVSAHSTHGNLIECSACHSQYTTTCYNCHFDTEIEVDSKKAYPAAPNWKFLVKRDGKIRLGAFMTLINDDTTGHIVVAPYYSHTIDPSPGCDCHNSDMMAEYNASGTMTISTWNSVDDKVDFTTGVIPITTDWKTAIQNVFVNLDSPGGSVWSEATMDTVSKQILLCEPIPTAELPTQF